MQVLHTVVISDLEPNTEYYFECGDGITFSDPITFKTLQAAGQAYPQRLLLIADWGLSYNCELALHSVHHNLHLIVCWVFDVLGASLRKGCCCTVLGGSQLRFRASSLATNWPVRLVSLQCALLSAMCF